MGVTYRMLAEEWSITPCEGGPSCRKKLSAAAHHRGQADAFGIIHWTGWDQRVYYMRPFATFLQLISQMDRSIREAPAWKKPYLTSTWAYKTAIKVYHHRLHSRYFDRERDQVFWRAKRAGINLREDYPVIRLWTSRRTKPPARRRR